MRFSRLYNLLIESDESSPNSKAEMVKRAKDAREHIEKYPDIDLAKVLRYRWIEEDNWVQAGSWAGQNMKGDRKFMSDTVHVTQKGQFLFLITPSKIWKFPVEDVKAYQKNMSSRDINKWESTGIMVAYFTWLRREADNAMEYMKGWYDLEPKMREYHKPGFHIEDILKRWENGQNITTDDKNFLMEKYHVTDKDFLRYFIEQEYFMPKHPDEFPKELHTLPRAMQNRMTYNSKTPLAYALQSARITMNGQRIMNFAQYLDEDDADDFLNFKGFARILNTASNPGTQFPPSKKEAFEWMKYVAKETEPFKKEEIKYTRAFNDVDAEDPFRNHKVWNFPSWLIQEVDKQNTESIKKVGFDLSFQTWMTFRWFLHSMKSVYWKRVQHIHGPAGQMVDADPLNYVSHIQEVDLVNGIKTSPELAFRAAGERTAKEFAEANAEKQFNYYAEFEDTPKVKVIRNVKALGHEGQRLKHCVGGYGPSCLSQKSLILSLANSTAELDPYTFDVFQHRSMGNSQPPVQDVLDLNEWIQLNMKHVQKHKELGNSSKGLR